MKVVDQPVSLVEAHRPCGRLGTGYPAQTHLAATDGEAEIDISVTEPLLGSLFWCNLYLTVTFR